jgi:hypothetical protein
MNKDLHNIDDIFNSAQQRFEEEPSADVWDKINVGLDKKDAESYRIRFVGWKRVAIVLTILLSGFVLYESGIIRGSGRGNKNSGSDKNSVPVYKPVQNNTAVNIPKNQPEKNTDINGSPALPDDKTSITDTNQSDIPVTEKENVSGSENKIIKITKKDRNIIADQIVTISSAVKKNSELKRPVSDINNGITGKSPANESPAFKKIRIIPADKLAGAENLIQKAGLEKSLLLLIPDSLLNKTIIEKKGKKGMGIFQPYWTISGFASSDLAQYRLENDEEDNNRPAQNEKDVISGREKHESSFSASIMVTRQFQKHLGIKTGLIYSNIAIVIDPQKIYAAQAPDGNIFYKYITSSGYAYVKPGFGLPPAIGDSLNSASAQHKLQSLSIPVLLTYRTGNTKFSIAPSAGITANFITSAKVETEVADALNRETVTINGLNGTKHFYIGFMADVNLQYNLDKHWAINVLPAFKYALSPITKSNVVKTYPYSLGVGAGVSYKF